MNIWPAEEEVRPSPQDEGDYWRSLGYRSYEVADLCEEPEPHPAQPRCVVEVPSDFPPLHDTLRAHHNYCSLRGDDGATHVCRLEHIFPTDGRRPSSDASHRSEWLGRRVICPHSAPGGAVYECVQSNPCVLYSKLPELFFAGDCVGGAHQGITHVCDYDSLRPCGDYGRGVSCPHSNALPATVAECKAHEDAQRKAYTAFQNGVVKEWPGERAREAWRSPGNDNVWVTVPSSSEAHGQGVLSAAQRIKEGRSMAP